MSRKNSRASVSPRFALRLAVLLLLVPLPASASLSESGGTGVFEVQSAESKRPGRLELGFFGSYRNLELGDSVETHVNTLLTGVNAAIGFGGGLELSGSLPIYGYYTTLGSTGSPLEESVRLRFGDADAQLRWTWPFLIPGFRTGVEGGVRFPTGSDKELTYPGRATQKPYTVGENNYFGRAMATWDGLRAGTGVPLRLHANATYRFQRDESRFIVDRNPLALELPAPVGERDNDYLTLGGAVELDLSRVTLFGEVVTDQFVNERSLLKGKENRIAVTPGIRFWIPGGLSIAGGYTFNLSEDDATTLFNPDRAYPDNEIRVAFSLGTVFRSARAKLEDEAKATSVPMVIPAPRAAEEAVAAAPVDSALAAKQAKEREILERRPIQEAPPAPKAPEPAPLTTEPAVTAPPARQAAPAPSAVAPAPMRTAPAPQAPSPPSATYVDTDGDGIPDSQDQCPLLAEDWDGFQDFDGCPDLDNDQDGIPDVRDQCPNDPENYNGYYDFDGCPDEAGKKWIERPSASATEGKPSASDKGTIAPRDSIPRAGGGIAAPSAAVAPRRTPAPESARAEAEVAPATPAPAAAAMRAPAAPAPTARAAPVASAHAAPAATASPVRADATSQSTTTADPRTSEIAQRNAALEARVRQLELELASVSARPLASHGGPTVIPVPTSGNADIGARLSAMEAELRALRAQRATPSVAGAAQPATPSAAPDDTTSQRILDELGQVQQSIDRMEVDRAVMRESSPGAEETTSEDADPALRALDLVLPLGAPRVFPDVQFESNSVALTPSGVNAVATLARALGAVPESRVSVIGHTDNYGETSYNRDLSLARARTVAEVLFTHGVGRDQITIDGRGEESPIATNATAAGRAMNRRVEFLRTR